jgi:hypothetical protein
VDSYGLGSEVPWGRLGYLMVRTPLLNELTYALLRRSRTMVRWSLYGLVYDRRRVTEEMVEETDRLLDDPQVGRAWRSCQKSEVGRGRLRTNVSDQLSALTMPTLPGPRVVRPGRAKSVGEQGARPHSRLRVEGVLRVRAPAAARAF